MGVSIVFLYCRRKLSLTIVWEHIHSVGGGSSGGGGGRACNIVDFNSSLHIDF
jgi:hypothetical protein